MPGFIFWRVINMQNAIVNLVDDISILNKTLSFHWNTNHQMLEALEKSYFMFEEKEFDTVHSKIHEIIRDIKIMKRKSDLLLESFNDSSDLNSSDHYEKCCVLFLDMDTCSMKWAEFYSTLGEKAIAQN